MVLFANVFNKILKKSNIYIMAASRRPGMYEFLAEAELQQYYSGLKNDLKVQNVSHLKYVVEPDLQQIGMTKPEIRRLKKFFSKYYPQGYIAKFKKMILPKDEKEDWDMIVQEESGVESKPPIRVPNKHIIPADSILVNKELGMGEFGIVQQGVWTNEGERIQVAIKCLSRERMQNNPIEFLKEAAIMHSIDHEHIVRLYGVVLDTNALMLVTELAPLRSLLECLKEPSLRSSFPVLTLCDFAIQICDGMQYLETKRLIHRDLAARNILVFSKNKVKISDFGLSRALGVGKDYYQTNFNVNLKLPIAWCAPECISYLRFTSSSDVWAYGVTLWEMFSYGFQPWAALTGHQILEAIDEPNFQRLEQPECCPKEYYSLMLKCWQHDYNKRPKFSEIMTILPECKPEQVQAIEDFTDDKMKKDPLPYHVGDIITVLNKTPVPLASNCWKGTLNNGKSGLFNPVHTVSYLGSNLPSNKPSELVRASTYGDRNSVYSSRRSRIRPEMISCPQGDVKHTGHVGLDGAYFGDISFLSPSTKYNHLPHQVVAPYKPQEDNTSEPSTPGRMCSDRIPLIAPDKKNTNGTWLDSDAMRQPLQDCGPISKQVGSSGGLPDHEYHEIGTEEPVAESPRFEKSFDFGPSLLDEMDAMFKTLGTEKNNSMLAGVSNYASSPPPSPLDVDINKRNELREIAATVAAVAHQYKGKKKQASVKAISAADEKTLDTAIAIANELAALSMEANLNVPPDSPLTPVPISPNKKKFTFRFPTPSIRVEGKTFSDEAASLPDIQEGLSEEARVAYNTLIESSSTNSTTTVVTLTSQSDASPSPLKILKKSVTLNPKILANKHIINDKLSLAKKKNSVSESTLKAGESNDANSCADLEGQNAIPLPPRDRTKPLRTDNMQRHQRKYPLVIPAALSEKLSATENPNTTLSQPEDVANSLPPVATNNINIGDDSYDQKIASDLAALDEIDTSENPSQNESISVPTSQIIEKQAKISASPPPKPERLMSAAARMQSHVSCEDLLDFASDCPNTRRSVSRSRGTESDEVRIMQKVLGTAVSGEVCVKALNVTDWDVHRAIKLVRLESILSNHVGIRNTQSAVNDSVANLSALEAMNWEVVKAASLILDNLVME